VEFWLQKYGDTLTPTRTAELRAAAKQERKQMKDATRLETSEELEKTKAELVKQAALAQAMSQREVAVGMRSLTWWMLQNNVASYNHQTTGKPLVLQGDSLGSILYEELNGPAFAALAAFLGRPNLMNELQRNYKMLRDELEVEYNVTGHPGVENNNVVQLTNAIIAKATARNDLKEGSPHFWINFGVQNCSSSSKNHLTIPRIKSARGLLEHQPQCTRSPLHRKSILRTKLSFLEWRRPKRSQSQKRKAIRKVRQKRNHRKRSNPNPASPLRR
jgi:hypothetical protein